MGGFGSGRYEYATTPTVRECYQIDADDLTEGIDYPDNAYGTREWNPSNAPTVDLTVHFETIDDSDRATHLRLEYTIEPQTGDNYEGEHPVGLEYTECNFGGVRPWFRCPGVVDGTECKRRVRKLYLPIGGWYWLCRECYDLGYQSSRASGTPLKEAELRYRRAFAKADKDNRRPHPNGEPYFPERPKGMHRDTFEELLDDVTEAHREWDDRSYERLREIVDRIDSDAGAHELPRT